METINKELYKWEYFPELDRTNEKRSFLYRVQIFLISILHSRIIDLERGWKKVRYFEVVDVESGRVRVVREDKS